MRSFIVAALAGLVFSATVLAQSPGTKESAHKRMGEIQAQLAAEKGTLTNTVRASLENELAALSLSLGGDLAITPGLVTARPYPSTTLPTSDRGAVRSAPAAPPNATTTSASFMASPGAPIDDMTPASSSIAVATADTYTWDVDLTVNITHTFASDLDFFLTSPGGTVVTISTDNGGGNDDVFNGTLFDDDAVDVSPTNIVNDFGYTNLVTATPLVPEGNLGTLIGQDPNGMWTLDVMDDAGGDAGTLVSWSLTITTLDVAPTVTVTTNQAAANNLAITDNATITDTVDFTATTGFICSVSLDTAITHTFASDLEITLTSAAGTVATVTTDNGGGNDDVFNGTNWLDGSPLVSEFTFTNLVTAPNLGPEGGFAAFIGEDPSGIWTLTVGDDAGGDTGNLASFGVNVTTCQAAGGAGPAPPPLPVPTLGPLGLLLLLILIVFLARQGLAVRRES